MKNPNKFPEAEMQDLARDAEQADSWFREEIRTQEAETEKQIEQKEMTLAARLENEACAALGVF